MTSSNPNPVSSPSQSSGFEGIRHDIENEAQAMYRQSYGEHVPEYPRLSLKQELAIHRAAAHGILAVLEGEGIEEAATLSKELREATEADSLGLTSLFTVGQQHEGVQSADSPRDPEEERTLALLAHVVDQTAGAAVAALVGSNPKVGKDDTEGAALGSIRRAGYAVTDYDMYEGRIAGGVLHAMLDEIEAIPLPKPQERQTD